MYRLHGWCSGWATGCRATASWFDSRTEQSLCDPQIVVSGLGVMCMFAKRTHDTGGNISVEQRCSTLGFPPRSQKHFAQTVNYTLNPSTFQYPSKHYSTVVSLLPSNTFLKQYWRKHWRPLQRRTNTSWPTATVRDSDATTNISFQRFAPKVAS
uniref:SFRICE_016953 n=1 Tax=Spodoptera frugiperda TaxID=7108 RepID=A0A2H1WU25_SPOFR